MANFATFGTKVPFQGLKYLMLKTGSRDLKELLPALREACNDTASSGLAALYALSMLEEKSALARRYKVLMSDRSSWRWASFAFSKIRHMDLRSMTAIALLSTDDQKIRRRVAQSAFLNIDLMKPIEARILKRVVAGFTRLAEDTDVVVRRGAVRILGKFLKLDTPKTPFPDKGHGRHTYVTRGAKPVSESLEEKKERDLVARAAEAWLNDTARQD